MTSEKTLVIGVCNSPDLAQDNSIEVGTAEDANCNISGDDVVLLGVVLAEDLLYESELPLCWREGCGHGE